LVSLGISRGELSSRVREFLRGLGREGIERLSRGEFARAVGVDPLTLPSEYKRELARVMYHEFGLPYRKVCELLAMSARDVARAVRGGAGTGGTMGGPAVSEVSVELQARAIELVRSGEARNPNDLVLKLRIPLDVAERLFNRVVRNEGITTAPVLDAVSELGDLVEEARELRDVLRDERSKLLGEVLKLRDLVGESRRLVDELEGLRKLGVEVAKLPEYLKHLQELRREVVALKKDFENTTSRVAQLEDKYRRLDERIGGLERSLSSLERDRKLLEVGLVSRFALKEYMCVYMDYEGYCRGFAYAIPPEGLAPGSIKAVVEDGRTYYYINVEKNRLVCALCPRYTPQIAIQQIKYGTRG
jgi:hypothetical protein